MRNLISRTPHSIVSVVGEAIYRDHCGLLTGPVSSFHPDSVAPYGGIWAADNGCFLPGYNPDRILSMLKRYQGIPNCKWAVVPDVVKDARATLLMFSSWISTYQRYDYPAALALQNGIEDCTIPWDSLVCVFIGGDDEFKYSSVVQNIVIEAHRRGKWVHMGRVNGAERILYSRSIECDSFDGTHYTHHTKDVARFLPLQLAHPQIAQVAYQPYQKQPSIYTQEKLAI